MSGPPEAWLAGEVTTLALCWKLTRGDGLVLGFTGHDQDLRLAGVCYRSRPGMTPSAISHSMDLSADSMEAQGHLNSAGLTAEDLDSGRWADAKVELFACDWRNTGAGQLGLMPGTLGAVSRTGFDSRGAFRAGLLSELAAMEAVEPLRLSPLCRADLGDGRCGVDPVSYTHLDVYKRQVRCTQQPMAVLQLERHATGRCHMVKRHRQSAARTRRPHRHPAHPQRARHLH